MEGGEYREVKDHGKLDLFHMGLQTMGHVVVSFFKNHQKFRIKMKNSRQLIWVGNPLGRSWKDSKEVDFLLMDVVGVLCKGDRHLDGCLPALRVCRPAGVCCCQFCLSSA